MREGANIVLREAARFYTPLTVLFACVLLLTRAPAVGVGLSAGFAFAIALVVHVLVFGAAAARAAAPPFAVRVVLSLGLIAAIAAAAAPRLLYAPQLAEVGVFVTAAAGAALIVAVLVGRAPAMRGEEL